MGGTSTHIVYDTRANLYRAVPYALYPKGADVPTQKQPWSFLLQTLPNRIVTLEMASSHRELRIEADLMSAASLDELVESEQMGLLQEVETFALIIEGAAPEEWRNMRGADAPAGRRFYFPHARLSTKAIVPVSGQDDEPTTLIGTFDVICPMHEILLFDLLEFSLPPVPAL